MLAKAECQSLDMFLTHRIREQARSHMGSVSDAELLAVRTHRRQMLLELRVIFQVLQHLVQ